VLVPELDTHVSPPSTFSLTVASEKDDQMSETMINHRNLPNPHYLINQTTSGPLVRALPAYTGILLVANEFSIEGHSFGGNGALNYTKNHLFYYYTLPFYNV